MTNGLAKTTSRRQPQHQTRLRGGTSPIAPPLRLNTKTGPRSKSNGKRRSKKKSARNTSKGFAKKPHRSSILSNVAPTLPPNSSGGLQRQIPHTSSTNLLRP